MWCSVLVTTTTISWAPRMCQNYFIQKLSHWIFSITWQSTYCFLFFWQRLSLIICPSSHKFIQTQVCLIRVQPLSISCWSPHRYGSFTFIIFKRKSSNLTFGGQLGFSWVFSWVKNTRFVKFLPWAPTRCWSHYSKVLVLCHLINAADFACFVLGAG